MQHQVSIVIPVYNVSNYIERCLNSVINQTYKNIECIIVNDSSEDDSNDKCIRMISSYNGPIQFRILNHQHKYGLSAARNSGTNAAMGDYVFYLDSDDELTPDCIEKLMMPIYKNDSIEMVLGNVNYYSDGYPLPFLLRNRKILSERYCEKQDIVRNYYFERYYYPEAWNRIIKKDFLIKNKLRFKEGIIWEAKLWTFSVMKYLSNLYVIPDVTYNYYKRPHSITTGTCIEERRRSLGLVFYEIANHFTEGESGREASFFLRDFCRYYINNYRDKLCQEVLHLFKEALDDRYNVYLSITTILSKTIIGRFLLQTLFKVQALCERCKLICIR